MKKISVVALVLVLSFALVGCLGVSEDEGVGKLILNSDVTVTDADADANPESEAPVVMIDDEEYSFGEAINLKSGKHEVTIMEEIDGMTYGTIIEDVVVERGKTTMYEDGIDLPVAQGTLKIEFDPADFEDELSDFDNIVVGVVGGNEKFGDWTTDPISDADIPELEEGEDGVYSIEFEDIVVGDKYKLLVKDETGEYSWDTNVQVGQDDDGALKVDGDNIEVEFDDLEM